MEDIKNEEDHTQMFLDLSKQLIDKGDYEHAERLLRGGLLRAQKKKAEADMAVKDLKAELVKIYEMQGKAEELKHLEKDKEN